MNAQRDKYGLTMPVSRRETVAAKYLLGVILTAAGALLSFAVGLLFGADMTEYVAVVTMLAGICFLYLSVLLPIVYKMGTEKARFIMLAVILLPFLLIMAGALYAKNSDYRRYKNTGKHAWKYERSNSGNKRSASGGGYDFRAYGGNFDIYCGISCNYVYIV